MLEGFPSPHTLELTRALQSPYPPHATHPGRGYSPYPAQVEQSHIGNDPRLVANLHNMDDVVRGLLHHGAVATADTAPPTPAPAEVEYLSSYLDVGPYIGGHRPEGPHSLNGSYAAKMGVAPQSTWLFDMIDRNGDGVLTREEVGFAQATGILPAENGTWGSPMLAPAAAITRRELERAQVLPDMLSLGGDAASTPSPPPAPSLSSTALPRAQVPQQQQQPQSPSDWTAAAVVTGSSGLPPDPIIEDLLDKLESREYSPDDVLSVLEREVSPRRPPPTDGSGGRRGSGGASADRQASRLLSVCTALRLQNRALAQSLAGLGASMYNCFVAADGAQQPKAEIVERILRYIHPCAHVAADLEALSRDLELELSYLQGSEKRSLDPQGHQLSPQAAHPQQPQQPAAPSLQQRARALLPLSGQQGSGRGENKADERTPSKPSSRRRPDEIATSNTTTLNFPDQEPAPAPSPKRGAAAARAAAAAAAAEGKRVTPHCVKVIIYHANGLHLEKKGATTSCICEIVGKKGKHARLSTKAVAGTDPVWNCSGVLTDYAHGDTLRFTVPGQGHVDLQDYHFCRDGYAGELRLQTQGAADAIVKVEVKMPWRLRVRVHSAHDLSGSPSFCSCEILSLTKTRACFKTEVATGASPHWNFGGQILDFFDAEHLVLKVQKQSGLLSKTSLLGSVQIDAETINHGRGSGTHQLHVQGDAEGAPKVDAGKLDLLVERLPWDG